MMQTLARWLAEEDTIAGFLASLVVIMAAIAAVAGTEAARLFRESARPAPGPAPTPPCEATIVDYDLPGLVARWSGPHAGARVLAY